jgi:hypothetical protein
VSTRHYVLTFGALFLAACGGGTGTQATAPLASAEAAVREFVAAATDRKIASMVQSWGTANGAAAVTGQPAQWEQRLRVVQVYLRGGTWRVLNSTQGTGAEDTRVVLMQFTRGDCVKSIPFGTIRTARGGWLVAEVDVSAAGNPVNPCPAPPSTPAPGNR